MAKISNATFLRELKKMMEENGWDETTRMKDVLDEFKDRVVEDALRVPPSKRNLPDDAENLVDLDD